MDAFHNNEDRVAAVAAYIGYDFVEPGILLEALHLAGTIFTDANGDLLREGNKSLAGVGDRVISLVITRDAHEDRLTIGTFLLHLARRWTPVF